MKATSRNVALVTLQCVVVIWAFINSPSFSTAWSTTTTCARYSYSRRWNRYFIATNNEAIAESSSKDTSSNRQSTSAANPKLNQSIHSLHLLSLPPTDDAFAKPGEFLIRECWRWKDSVLGDGRDYFIPRPRALKKFHSLFVGVIINVTKLAGAVNVMLTLPRQEELSKIQLRLPLEQYSNVASTLDSLVHLLPDHSFSERFIIEECVVLSNCARLDVLLALKNIREGPNFFSPSRLESDSADNSNSHIQNVSEIAAIAARYAVAYNLHRQIQHSRRSKGVTMLQRTGLSSWLDLPGVIETSAATSSITQDQFASIDQLGQRLISIEGPHAISTHLCLIACGLAQRTNRPDREVIFRPYSSRDAHIMLQLKRTAEVISVLNYNENTDSGGGRGRIKTLIDGALHAGKAARNEKKVPEILKLKVYGSDGTPPSALANDVANAAIKQAVNESVSICVSRLAAMDTNAVENISLLRQRVNEVVASLGHCKGSEMLKRANKLLHTPTMQLRQGILSGDDIEDVVRMIENELIGQFSGIEP